MIFYIFRANDIEKATAAKYEVEQKQREEAKLRKDTQTDFDNRVSFKLIILILYIKHNFHLLLVLQVNGQ